MTDCMAFTTLYPDLAELLFERIDERNEIETASGRQPAFLLVTDRRRWT